MGKLSNKVAVITGIAQGGTGFGMAATFLREGASLIVSDISEKTLNASLAELKTLGNVVGCVGDVGVRADADRTIRAAIDNYGQLDILVNNAAASTPGVLIEDMTDALIHLNLGSSLYGTIYHMQAAFPHLKRNGGSVINFGSRNGVLGAAGFSMYAAAKEGIRGLSRAMAREWGPHNIRINVICPATLSDGAKAFLEADPVMAENQRSLVALGYFGDAVRDVAPVALFLASDDSHYVTGQTINVDGGQVML